MFPPGRPMTRALAQPWGKIVGTPGSRFNRSYVVKLWLISHQPAPTPQLFFMQGQDHKRRVWHLILADEAISAGRDKAEAWVIRRMSEDHHTVVPPVSALCYPGLD